MSWVKNTCVIALSGDENGQACEEGQAGLSHELEVMHSYLDLLIGP